MMNQSRYTFQRAPHWTGSFICALALSSAIFSILPISLSADFEGNKEKFTKVYTLPQPTLNQTDTSSKNSKKNQIAESMPSHSSRNFQPQKITDFADCSLPMPTFKNGGNFEISGFSGSVSEISTTLSTFDIASLDSVPRRIRNADIKYPKELLRRGVEGDVVLNVIIDEDGFVHVESVAKSTNKLFESAAVEGASKLRYQSPKKDGVAARAKFALPIPFRIQK